MKTMNTIVITITIIIASIGIILFIWSIYNTRVKYYNEYLKRKRGTDNG